MTRKIPPQVWTLSRVLLGLFFLASGFSKIIRPSEYFQAAIHQYSLFPDLLVPIIAVVVPWIEYIFGAFLAAGYMPDFSAQVLLALTAGFQILLGQAVMRQLPIDECGCFGGGRVHLSLYQSFLLDTLILVYLIFYATAGDRNDVTVELGLRKEFPQAN